ncbi:Vesicle-associated membrane protein 727 [Vitis vinifera]|uniref:Vesicle-associated membrane protein 727 n=1 Tax=Vitis vinifera TaxID=29760 RepID=A0A438DDQ2_VITVI|nr:Vesicle-associated membrane protein 727 [Vitis vinifera]
MSQKGLIYSFVAKGTVVLAEHTSFSGNFSTIAVQCLQKLPSNSSKYTYSCDGHTFNFLIDSGFVFLVVADESAGRGAPFVFLERVKDDFKQRYGGSIRSDGPHPLADEDDDDDDLFEDRFSIAYNLDREFGPKLKEHMQYCMNHPEEISKLSKLKAQITEVKGIMMDNIEKLSCTPPPQKISGLVFFKVLSHPEGQILDAALVANEVIDSVLKRKESGVLCKLDLKKAYDWINWDFLLSVMQRMGFGEKWIGWIRWCISTASFSVLVNGSPTGFFRSSRGLRQGDPLSPYLFVLGMEALSSLINRAVRGGFLSGCRIGGREGVGIQVTHLLFADDTLVFCDDSQEQLAFLSWLLMWFEATSGLRINLNKSEILLVGCVVNAELLEAELGCKVGSLPSTYLGLPLGALHKSVKVWDGVEERMRKKLALWKRQFISKGGRLTLIRSTLASMPTYLMSLLRMPRVVKLRLEKIQRDFLWGGGALEKRPHLVKWAVVCTHKKMGGLGIRNLSILNRALLCNGVGVMRLKETHIGSLLLVRSMGLKEEGGARVGLGRVMGLGFGRKSARKTFQQLGGGGGGETPIVHSGKRLDVDGEDRMLWRGTKNEIFTIKSLYKSLDHSYAVSFPGNIIWSPYVPSKVSFFAWEASWRRSLLKISLRGGAEF